MACIRLTESQRQVMDLLWDSGESFTSTEIVDRCPDRTWKETYTHILINSMLKKGVIEVSGFVQTTKNYARTFRAAISRDEYMLHQMIGP